MILKSLLIKSIEFLMKKFTYEQAYEATLDYFDNDELAASVFLSKYAVQDKEGNYLETTPDDMHKRMASEFARIEEKYENPMSESEIYALFKDFRYVVPQGSPMSGIGNDFKIQSLSNCFVIESPYDSYGGILKTDQKLSKDLDEARNSVQFSFSRDQDFVNKQITDIDTFFIYLNDIYGAHELFISSQDSLYKYRYEPEFESYQTSFIADSTTYVTLYSEFLNQYQFQIDKAQWDQLLGINESLAEPINLELFKNQIKQICLNRWAEGIIDEPLENILSDEISIIQGGELVIAPTKNYNDIETAWKKNREEVNQIYENELDIMANELKDLCSNNGLPDLSEKIEMLLTYIMFPNIALSFFKELDI